MELIAKWQDEKKQFGIVLPNGWFGRPYDNLHTITWHFERKNKKIIEIDGQLFFMLTGDTKFTMTNEGIEISNFDQFVFDWQGYGDMKPHVTYFKKGKITLIDQTSF